MTRTQMAEKMSRHGLRATAQRLSVYEYLFEHRTHPTVEMIYEDLLPDNPSFSRTTVYNTLHALEKYGMIRSLTIDAGEMHYDADPCDHGHFLCSECKTIYDFPISSKAVSYPEDFEAEQIDIFISGTCKRCKEKTL